MSNPYYVTGAERAEKVGDLFGAIARRYDLLNDVLSLGLHRRWKRRVVELASIGPGGRALDLCCGTGDISFALAARGAVVTGLDFSQAMLEIAEARSFKIRNPKSDLSAKASATAEVRNPKFMQGDAMKVPFSDASFDAVTIGYGLRNLASWEAGLREMLRVTKPGGRLVVLDFGKPANALWRGTYFLFLRMVVPVMGLMFCGNASAYAYILESLKQYPGQAGVAAKMRDLGLANVSTINLMGGAMGINVGEKPRG